VLLSSGFYKKAFLFFAGIQATHPGSVGGRISPTGGSPDARFPDARFPDARHQDDKSIKTFKLLNAKI